DDLRVSRTTDMMLKCCDVSCPQVYDVVRCIQLLMALLSVLGSGSIIVCVMSQRLSRRPELQPLFLLSVSDLLLALCWLIGAALFSEHRNTHCYNLHTVEQVLFMSSFFFTLNYMWDLFRGIREKLHRCLDGHSLEHCWKNHGSALLVPLLLMTPVFIQGNIRQCQANFSQPYRCLLMDTGALYLTAEHQQPIRACHLLHTYTIAVFLAAFVLTLVGITVFVVKARRIYRRVVTSHGYLGNEQRTSLRVMDRRMLLYPLVFVLCWGPAASLASLRVAKPSACQGQAVVVLYISQAFTSASQGFLNCLVYGWTHTRLRRVGRTGQSRDMDTQTPLLRSQKKKNYQALTVQSLTNLFLSL
uniref:G-protein coupled receptors family 1 profile domain-containing protein n=1 Tax=Scophthalmus maximus TaxID=52904 RepID=A0A8D2ZSN1_SCOMX